MEFLRKECLRTGIELNDLQISRFSNYYHALIEWNKKINLTSIVDEKEVVTRHFMDSLEVLRVINSHLKPPFRVIDIGSGAGFPGIPVAIMEDKANVDLVESTGKKTTFLEHVVSKLNLINISIHNTRAELLGRDPSYRERFDVATARGVGQIFVSLEYLFPFCRIGGIVTILTKPGLGETVGKINSVMETLGGSFLEYREILGPDQLVRRGIVVGKKQFPTPPGFPRRSGAITKNPLQPKNESGHS
jgi:16S rRNA (guanine527-N7)-methyltransferase